MNTELLRTSELRPEVVDLLIDRAALGRPYLEMAAIFYRQLLATHDQPAGDLTEFLRTRTPRDNRYGYGEEEINFIASAPGTQGDTFDKRRSFINLEITHDLDYALALQQPPPIEERYEHFLSQDVYEPWDEDRLDGRFNLDGSDPEQLDRVNLAMVDFAIACDDPDLARYFLGRIEYPANKIDLYFKTIIQNKQSNAAELCVSEMLRDLKQQLQAQPLALASFLIREIRELGSQLDINIDANRGYALALLSEDAGYRFGEKLELPKLKYELAKALLFAGREDEAWALIDERTKYKFEMDRWLIVAQMRPLSKPEIRHLRKSSKSNDFYLALNAKLTYCIARGEPSGLDQFFAENLEYSDYYELTEEQRRYFKKNHPDLAATRLKGLEKLPMLVAARDVNASGREFAEIIDHPYSSQLDRLRAAILIGSVLEQRPAEVLESEVQVAAKIELLALKIDDWEQKAKQAAGLAELSATATSIFNEITLLPLESVRQIYFGQLVQVCKSAGISEEIINTIQRRAEGGIKERYFAASLKELV